MCVIIHAPAGKEFPMRHIDDAWRANDDGAGYCITDVKTKEIKAVKGIMKLEKLKDALASIDLVKNHLTVHFRIRTSGYTDSTNTHPWIIQSMDEDKRHLCAVMHNGIMQCVKPEKSLSDTGVWTRDFVLPLFNANVLHMQEVRHLLAAQVGAWNKVVIHQEGHDPAIINESSGQWIDGIWYSNTNFASCQKNWGYSSGYELDDEDFQAWRRSHVTPLYKREEKKGKDSQTKEAIKTIEAVDDLLSKEWEEGSPMDLLAEFIASPRGLTYEEMLQLKQYLMLPVTSFGQAASALPIVLYKDKLNEQIDMLELEMALNEPEEEIGGEG